MDEKSVVNQAPVGATSEPAPVAAAPSALTNPIATSIPTATPPVTAPLEPDFAKTPGLEEPGSFAGTPKIEQALDTTTTFAPASDGKAVKIFGLILFAIIAIGGASAAGYYFGIQNKPAEVVTEATPEPTASPTASPTPESITSDWVSAQHKAGGFTIKIPKDWSMEQSTLFYVGPKDLVEKSATTNKNILQEKTIIGNIAYGGILNSKNKTSTIKVNGLDVTIIEVDKADYKSGVLKEAHFPYKTDKKIVFSVSSLDLEETFDEMVSTFKLVEAEDVKGASVVPTSSPKASASPSPKVSASPKAQ